MKRWVLLTYVVAMAVMGFTHTASASPSLPSGINLADYILPGGALPAFCLDQGGQQKSDHLLKPVCDACLLTSSPGLLECENLAAPNMLRRMERQAFSDASGVLTARTAHVAHLRGPPAN